MDSPRVSYDSRGFSFSLRFVASVLILVSVAHFGTAFGAEAVLDAVHQEEIEAIEKKLEEIEAKRTMRSEGEVQLLQKLREYEHTLSTRTIGTASVETLALAHEKLIGADLGDMKLYLFENGIATETYDVLSKGKRGSRWETPTGLYKIETKEEDHFSTIGEVHMPKAMQFFGNFFIHGWPYYPDGTPVADGYSGGCIRLSTEDAKKVFAFAESGTPIFVWDGAIETHDETSIIIRERPFPRVTAKAYIIADIRSGEVFAEQDADTPLPIASLSKLLTALVANETIHFDRTLTIAADDRKQTAGTPGSIAAGDSFTIGDLLYPLLMESNNSVAYALARYYGADNFIRWMNDKARAIGMEHTVMEDPSGISPNNKASASDLFVLARYIVNSQSFILNISREKSHTITSENGRTYSLSNFNVFSGREGFLGGKTGYTDEARETMITIFEVPVGDETATLAIIVLGSADRKTDVEKLLAWFKAAASVE